MTIQVGDKLPDVPLTLAGHEGPQPTTSGEYFAGKRVALFAVPGAFTPTCSAKHLPSYVEKADELTQQGKLLGFQQLEEPRTARSVRIRGGKTSVLDGPFAEAKEMLGGFNLVEAAFMTK